MKYLGIDYGEKKVGLAQAESDFKIATPFKVIENKGDDFLIDEIQDILKKEDIDEIVIGIPLGLSGKKTAQTKSVLSFIESLKKAVHKKVNLEDERFTSRYADTLIRDLKEKKMQDAVAAMALLQSFLDKQK